MELQRDASTFFQGKNPFLAPGRLARVVEILGPVLRRHSYEKIRMVPGARGAISAPLPDIANVLTALTGRGNSTLRTSLTPELFEQWLRIRAPGCEILYRLFQRNGYVSRRDLLRIFTGDEIKELVGNFLLVEEGDRCFSLLKINVVEGGYFLSSAVEVTPGEYVYLGWDSYVLARTLAAMLRGKSGSRALDLCTGSGVQALVASPHFQQIIGVDINPNSPLLASANAELNGRHNCYFILSDLYTQVEGTFDLIIANPPYVYARERPEVLGLCGDGKGEYGMEIPLRIVEGWHELLSPSGEAIMITISPIIRGDDYLVSEVKRRFHAYPLAFEFAEVATHVLHRGLLDEHREAGISHATFYIVRARRATGFSLAIHPLPWFHHLLCWAGKEQAILWDTLRRLTGRRAAASVPRRPPS